jgi:flagellar protein FlgJ
VTGPITGAGAAAAPAVNPENERLRGVARDLEGVFVEQLFKAMRESVPDGGVVDGGSGEEMFTGLLDQKMAALAPASWERGLADALYRQLRGRIGEEQGAGATPTPAFRNEALAPILDVSTSTLPEPS